MNKFQRSGFFSILSVIVFVLACAPPEDLTDKEAEEIDAAAVFRPAWLKDDEKDLAKALKADGFFPYELTAPPTETVSPPPEWAQREGTFIRWPSGWNQLKPTFIEIVKALQKNGNVSIAVSHQRALDEAWKDIETCAECRPEDVEWLIIPTNTIWMRDYGPQFVHYENGERAVINLSYYSNRIHDDMFPTRYALANNLSFYSPGLYLEGGNFQTDGNGRCIASKHAAGYNGEEMARRHLENYLGCQDVQFISYMEQEGTRHIDMWFKFLDEQTAIVGNYRFEGHEPLSTLDMLNADILDEVAEKIEEMGYQVSRIPMPPTYGSGDSKTFRSYTNSVMLNGSLLLPIYDEPTDIMALRVYRELLPAGTDIIPVDTSYVIEYGGSLHCLTVENHGDITLPAE